MFSLPSTPALAFVRDELDSLRNSNVAHTNGALKQAHLFPGFAEDGKRPETAQNGPHPCLRDEARLYSAPIASGGG